MGKGEIACYEQFLLFPQCFPKACFPGASNGVLVWEWVKNIVGEKEKMLATNIFSVFHNFFILSKVNISPFQLHLKLLSANALNLDKSIVNCLVKGQTKYMYKTLSQTTNFRPFQTERVSRRQF